MISWDNVDVPESPLRRYRRGIEDDVVATALTALRAEIGVRRSRSGLGQGSTDRPLGQFLRRVHEHLDMSRVRQDWSCMNSLARLVEYHPGVRLTLRSSAVHISGF